MPSIPYYNSIVGTQVKVSGQNVGIGTNSPSSKLDVDGTITDSSGNSNQWNSAYNWGDHSQAGYATTGELISTSGYLQSQIDGLPADTNTFVTGVTFNSGNNNLVLFRNDSVNVTGNLQGVLVSGTEYHPTISAASSSDNSGRTYIQDITLDSNGHVIGLATATETVTDTDTTYTDGSGLSLSGTEFNVNTDNTTIEINADALRIKDDGVTSAKIAALDDLLRWEYPDKALDTATNTLGYMRLYDEVGAYCGLGVSTSSFNVGASGAINLRFLTSATERAIIDTNGNFVFNELGNNCDFRVEGDTDANLLFTDASSDRVGVGTSAPNGKLGVYHTLTKNTTGPSYEYGIHNSANHYTTGNGTNYSWGQTTDIKKYVASGITDTGYVMGTDLVAVLSDEGSLAGSYGLRTYAGINNQSDNGTLTIAYGIQSRVINYGQGTANINTARGIDVYIQGDLGSVGNGKITNAYGVYVQTPLNVTTNAYGLYVAAMDSGTTNKYGIYQNGANDTNVLMGNVGIGTASPSVKLDVNGTFSANSVNVNDAYTLPTSDGTAGQVLTTDGAGNIIFSGVSSGSTYTAGTGLLLDGTEFNITEPVVISDTGVITGSDKIANVISLTQAEYDGATKDDSTLYVITDATGTGGGTTYTAGTGLLLDGTEFNIDTNTVLTTGNVDTKLQSGAGISLVYDSGTSTLEIESTALSSVNGRLSLESNVAISTSDQTAKTTLYFVPHNGNFIALYDGTNWSGYSFSQLSLSLSGYAANTNFDIFVYDNAGTLTLESLAWTDDTTRATALTTQDGVYVKSGATTRRYIGTIRTTGTTGQCEDSESKRFVWNYYNRVNKKLHASKQQSHTYTSATVRAWANNTTYGEARYGFVVGIQDILITNHHTNLSKIMYVGFAVDSTTTYETATTTYNQSTSELSSHSSHYNFYPTIGFHYVQLIEFTDNVAASSYSSSMNGIIQC